MCLFDKVKNEFIGNQITVHAQPHQKYEDKWYFSSKSNSLIVKNDEQNVVLVFELVVHIENEKTPMEISCGWGSVDWS